MEAVLRKSRVTSVTEATCDGGRFTQAKCVTEATCLSRRPSVTEATCVTEAMCHGDRFTQATCVTATFVTETTCH